jgi:hypothetical protein
MLFKAWRDREGRGGDGLASGPPPRLKISQMTQNTTSFSYPLEHQFFTTLLAVTAREYEYNLIETIQVFSLSPAVRRHNSKCHSTSKTS